MKSIRLTDTVECRFTFETGSGPTSLNDIGNAARCISSAAISDTDFVQEVWKIPLGAEMSVPDKDADKLVKLDLAEAV